MAKGKSTFAPMVDGLAMAATAITETGSLAHHTKLENAVLISPVFCPAEREKETRMAGTSVLVGVIGSN